MRKKIVSAISAFAILVAGISLFIFMLNTPRFALPELSFEAAEAAMQSRGFTEKAETMRATYYITDGLKGDAKTYIRQCEIILDAAQGYGYRLDSNLRLFLTHDESTGLPYSSRSITIDPADISNRGKLFCGVSNNNLPYWLCSGIESYWLSYYKEIKLDLLSESKILKWAGENQSSDKPAFGDAWFIPGFLDNSDIKTVQGIAYTFVHHLQKKGQAAELSTLNEYEAQAFLTDAASEFLGHEILEPLMIWRSVENFKVLTDQCKYTFEYGSVKYDYVKRIIPKIDEGVLYAKDFLSADYDGHFNMEFRFSDPYYSTRAGGIANGEKIVLFDTSDLVVSVAVHEAAHILDSYLFRRSVASNSTFTEGLAQLVSINHDMDIKSSGMQEYCIAEYADYRNGNHADEDTRMLYEMYETMMGDAVSTEEIDLFVLRDAAAYLEMQDPDYLRAEIYPNASLLSDKDTYRQAGSFFQFLYQRYGLEKIKKIYLNRDLTEQEFGTSLEDLVSQWKADLSHMADNSRK